MTTPHSRKGIITVDGTVWRDLYRIAGRRFSQFMEDLARPPSPVTTDYVADPEERGERDSGNPEPWR